jgi:hypothetical protein
MSAKEAAALAGELAGYGGKLSLATRMTTMEAKCRRAGRLIQAMLRQTNQYDLWKLPPEASAIDVYPCPDRQGSFMRGRPCCLCRPAGTLR